MVFQHQICNSINTRDEIHVDRLIAKTQKNIYNTPNPKNSGKKQDSRQGSKYVSSLSSHFSLVIFIQPPPTVVPQEVTEKNTHSFSPACSSPWETAQVSIMFANLPIAKTNLQWSTVRLYSNIYNPLLFSYHMVEEKKFVKYLEVSL